MLRVLSFRRTTAGSLPTRWGRVCFAFWLACEAWLERRCQLRALAALDDAALKDLGLSRADVEYWAEPPAWRDDPWRR